MPQSNCILASLLIFVFAISLGCSPEPKVVNSGWQPSIRYEDCLGSDLPGFKSRCAKVELETADVAIAVAVIEPVAGGDLVPAVFLTGGPGEGGNTTDKLDEWRYWASDIGLARPLVLWQPRGTAGSSGYFECRSFNDWLLHHESGSDRSLLVALESCLVQWRASWKSDLAFEQFSSLQSAKDFLHVMKLLGYERWHIWASSYGGRLANVLLSEAPDAVVSVIFDSAVTRSLEKPSDFAQRWVMSMHELFGQACASSQCKAEALEEDFWRAVDQVAKSASAREFKISQAIFAHWVFAQGFDESSIHHLPDLLSRIGAAGPSREDVLAIERFASVKTAPSNNPWVYYAALCNDLRRQSAEEFQNQVARLGRWQQFWLGHELIDVCPLMNIAGEPVGKVPANLPAVAPALFLSSRFDPVIPFVNVVNERNYFDDAAILVKNGAAHGILRKRMCGDSLAELFWHSPENFLRMLRSNEPVDLNDCEVQ